MYTIYESIFFCHSYLSSFLDFYQSFCFLNFERDLGVDLVLALSPEKHIRRAMKVACYMQVTVRITFKFMGEMFRKVMYYTTYVTTKSDLLVS